ncbi:MAG: hypothetical protein J5738_03490 [Lachnospiraceae bacterium]|nr:hypothetical protein [Lachnospiraceae bacterium]
MSDEVRKTFDFPKYVNVHIHKECKQELELLVQKENIPAFIKAYQDRIAYLSQNIGKETFHRQWFEILKGTKGLRAIRFLRIQNIRILYIVDGNNAYLLLAFEERQGHRKDEYANYFSPAYSRYQDKEMLE